MPLNKSLNTQIPDKSIFSHKKYLSSMIVGFRSPYTLQCCHMSSLSIPKIHLHGSNVIITKSNTSLFFIITTFPMTYLYNSNTIT